MPCYQFKFRFLATKINFRKLNSLQNEREMEAFLKLDYLKTICANLLAGNILVEITVFFIQGTQLACVRTDAPPHFLYHNKFLIEYVRVSQSIADDNYLAWQF